MTRDVTPPGRFITFEGGEAAGKSTQIVRLAARLRAAGHTVLEVREPGATPLGEKVRHLLKHDPAGLGMSPEAELLLMNASRAELVRKVIRPALASGAYVLSDRFHDSTTAYQGHGRGLDLDLVAGVIRVAVGETRPDLTLFLDVPPAMARERLRSRRGDTTAPDRFDEEKEAFFERVNAGYRSILAAEPRRFIAIDASGSPDTVESRIWDQWLRRGWV